MGKVNRECDISRNYELEKTIIKMITIVSLIANIKMSLFKNFL